jgi:hypothetical protein
VALAGEIMKKSKKASAVKALIGSMTGGLATGAPASTGGTQAPPFSKGKSKMSFGKRKTFGAAILLACILSAGFATRALAQTTTTTSTATWVQGNTLADAQSFKYALLDVQVPNTPPVPVATPTCQLAQAVVVCQGQVPPPAAGPHKFVLQASSPDGNLTASSSQLVGIMPGAPSGFKVVVTSTVVITTPVP